MIGYNYQKITGRIPKESTMGFTTTLIFGLFVHAYKFLNTLPNHDSLYNTYSNQNAIMSGRWFLCPACALTSFFDLPWVIGVSALILIACSVAMIVWIFQVKNPFAIIIISGVIVSHPSVTETLFFEFTADGYFLAMFLSTIAIGITRIETVTAKRLAIGCILLALSCGIYQAYVSFAMALAICYFVWQIFCCNTSVKKAIYWCLSQIAMYIVALAIYYITWKILLHFEQLQPNMNQGINNIGIRTDTILSALPASIKNFAYMFVEWNIFEYGMNLYGFLGIAFLVTAGFVMLVSIGNMGLF